MARRYRTVKATCVACGKPTMVRPGRAKKCPECGKKTVPQPFTPSEEDRERVWAAVAFGMEIDEMRLGVINPKTKRPVDAHAFRKAFREEIASAKARYKLELAGNIVADMRAGETCGTRIFLSKVHFGFRETSRHEMTGDGGGPIVIKVTPNEAAY